MKLSTILDEQVELPLPVAGDTLVVRYRPAAYNEAFLEKEQDLNSQLLDLLAGWNLTDDDGAPVPLDLEHLKRLPLPLRRRIGAELEGVLLPNPMTTGQ